MAMRALLPTTTYTLRGPSLSGRRVAPYKEQRMADERDPKRGPAAVKPVPFTVTDPCRVCQGHGSVVARTCHDCQGTGVERFYHGTKAGLELGSLIEPGRRANFGEPDRIANYVYMSGTLDAATWGAELAQGDGRGRIYIVEPTGPIENDPNLTDKRYPGNPTKSYRSRAPLRVTGEVTDWVGHSADELKAMHDGLERLAREGHMEIDD